MEARKSAAEVLVERDGVSHEVAEKEVEEVQSYFMDCIAAGDFAAAEDAMSDIGLEPDYLDEFM